MRLIILLQIACLLIVGCTKSPDDNTNTFTLASGVKLVDNAECTESDTTMQSLAVHRIASGYRVKVVGYFACQDELEPPYLTPDVDGKSTLVLAPKRHGFGFSTSCECSRKLSIDLNDRLKANQTLYVLNDRDVIGHVVVP